MALYPGDAVLGMGVDQSGNAQNIPVRTHNTAKAATQRGVTIAGSDGTNDQVIKVDNQGRLDVTGSTVTLDYSGTPDAAAPVKAAFVGGMGEAAAEVLDEGDLGALSLTLGSELRVVQESTSAAGGAAAPVRTAQVGAKANAAAPASVDENDIIPLSATLAGNLRTRLEAAQAAFDAAAPADVIMVGTVANAVADGPDEGDAGRLSITLGAELRVINESATAAGGAAAPVRTAQIGGKANAAAPGAVDENDLVPLSCTLAGVARAILSANSGVDIGDVDVLSVIPGTGATNLGKAADSVAGATDTGLAPLAVRDDALGALTPIEGDYVPLRTDANGALWTHDDALDAALAGNEIQVDIVASLPAGTNGIGKLTANSGVDVGDVDVTSTPYDTTLGAAPGATGALVAGSDGAATRALKLSAAGNVLLGANSGVDIGDVDITSVVPGTGATALGKAIDAVAGAADTGVAPLAVRDDALAALTPIEGDYAPLRVDANGALWTHDDALDAALAGTELQVDIVGALPTGANAIGKLAANTGVDIGDVDITSVIPGTGATNLGKAVDSVAGATDTGIAPLAVRDDALGGLTEIAGDYVPLRTDANGALWTHDDALDAALAGTELQVDIVAALPAGTNAIGKLAANSGVDIGDVDVTSLPGVGATGAAVPASAAYIGGINGANLVGVAVSSSGAVTTQTAGDIAHDAADSGKPLKIGGKATIAMPAVVTEGDRADASFDLRGILRTAVEGETLPLFASAARGAGAGQVSSTYANLARYKYMSAILDVTAAATEVDDTLDVYIDTSYDGGTTWVNIVHFTQVLGNGGAKRFGAAASIAGATGTTIIVATADLTTAPDIRHFLGDALRGRYTIVDPGGGAASFTFQLSACMK